jgi:hypothetical protein
VTGLFRDMRGIAIATNSRRTYGERSSSPYMWTPTQRHPQAAALAAVLAHIRLCLNISKHCVISVPMHAGLLFDWLHPAHFATIVAALEAWADVPEVSTGGTS